jgi:hypothetical protein
MASSAKGSLVTVQLSRGLADDVNRAGKANIVMRLEAARFHASLPLVFVPRPCGMTTRKKSDTLS